MDLIIGTAGHIDHGKTALVRALTGVDADRLPEEKRRGITIDLGFAELDLGEIRFGFIDVPGHERFVKNMLAGAHGIDLVMLIIAADEGVMPQTREHFDICRLLKIKAGLVVITKTDLVDAELLELVRLETAELVQNSFLESAPVVAVSSKTNDGIENLKQVLREIGLKIPARKNETVARLPVDRAFSVKGFGTVVTGTLVAGEIREGEELELLPANRKVRIRGLQTHGKSVAAAHAGQRTAVNLNNVDVAEIKRGDVLAPPQTLRATQIIDVEIEVLPDAPKNLRSRQRVRFHIGAIEVLARLQILEDAGEIKSGARGFAQLRTETPIVAIPGEHFIVRSYSPARTVAGGTILDALAAKHRRKDFAAERKRLADWLRAEGAGDKQTQLQLFLAAAGEAGLNKADLKARTGWRGDVLQTAIESLLEKKAIVKAEDVFIARTTFDNLLQKALTEIEIYHKREPLARGAQKETLREKVFAHLPPETFRAALTALETRRQIVVEKDFVRSAAYNQNLSVDSQQLLARLEQIYLNAKLEVPTLENALADSIANTKITKEQARRVFQLLIERGELISVTPEFYFRRAELDSLVEKMRDFAARQKVPDHTIDVAQFKDLGQISRKYAIPLLEYFDREKITRRAGDKRIIL